MKNRSLNRPTASSKKKVSVCVDRNWQFNHQSENFYPLVSGRTVSGVNVRRPDGQVVFIPMVR